MQKQNFRKSFVFSFTEFSGALADLGVMLPLILALISINGMDATSVFVGVGIAYILVAFVYRLPIPIQPLKSVSAVAIALGLSPAVIVSGAIWNALTFLGMGFGKLDRWVIKAFPKPVIRGIQLGLSWLLFKSAWKLFSQPATPWQGGLSISNQTIAWIWILISGGAIFLLVFLSWKKDFAALGVVTFGVGISVYHLGLPPLTLQLTIPRLLPLVPSSEQLWQGLILLAIPQIPLSLGNSIFATADTAKRYFGNRANHVNEQKLMITMGTIDGITAMLGGVPLCHGCGGLTAHYRMGARTGGAPLMLGGIFLVLGLLGGQASMQILDLIPFPVLGVLLAYIGIQHIQLALDLKGRRDWITALLVLAMAILTNNLAAGFISGALFYYLWGMVTTRLIPDRGMI